LRNPASPERVFSLCGLLTCALLSTVRAEERGALDRFLSRGVTPGVPLSQTLAFEQFTPSRGSLHSFTISSAGALAIAHTYGLKHVEPESVLFHFASGAVDADPSSERSLPDEVSASSRGYASSKDMLFPQFSAAGTVTLMANQPGAYTMIASASSSNSQTATLLGPVLVDFTYDPQAVSSQPVAAAFLGAGILTLIWYGYARRRQRHTPGKGINVV
jgi:hypothetical protein